MPANQVATGTGAAIRMIAPYDPNKCEFPECSQPKRKMDWCNKHYMRIRRQENTDPYLIAEDGIIDMTAVDIAVAGVRLIRLTVRERELAAQRILAGGGTQTMIRRNLALPTVAAARSLCKRVRATLAEDPAQEHAA